MRPNRAEDISGQVFGRLTVIERAPRRSAKNRRAVWRCACECGGEANVGTDALKSGHTKSCGCLSAETAIQTHTTHGMSGSREYQAWVNMRSRCSGVQKKSWKNYGGRGIGVCEEWDQSFEAFYSHVGDSPGEGYELDRENNDRGYEPGNVRWVTKRENNLNKRNSKSGGGQ